jgi:polysaccharide export outer membrane protein
MAALSAGGCMQTAFAPDPGAVSHAALTVPPNLDSLAYERRLAPPTAYAAAQPQQAQPQQAQPRQAQLQQAQLQQAQSQPQQPLPRQSRHNPPTPAAAGRDPMEAHAQAIPVVAQLPPDPAYRLDTGDKLRVVVFGQEGLSNSYLVDAAGQVTIPLIGAVMARGLTTQGLARSVAAKLRAGFIREPHVAIEVETYRPFFILGEVIQPGQYPYVPNMTVETAVAIAGGFTPRAYRYDVKIDRPTAGDTTRSRASVPLLTRVQPGDTIIIKERWF